MANLISRELPRYRCTKEVGALKIAKIVFDADLAQREGRGTDGSATIHPAESGYEPFVVSREWLTRHEPKAGGYFVAYDGEEHYTSWSPGLVFESGYVRIEPEK